MDQQLIAAAEAAAPPSWRPWIGLVALATPVVAAHWIAVFGAPAGPLGRALNLAAGNYGRAANAEEQKK